jgi:hypothetical protein
MKNLNRLKILIVGLTSVLALSNFNNKDLRKGKVDHSALNVAICQSQDIQINS